MTNRRLDEAMARRLLTRTGMCRGEASASLDRWSTFAAASPTRHEWSRSAPLDPGMLTAAGNGFLCISLGHGADGGRRDVQRNDRFLPRAVSRSRPSCSVILMWYPEAMSILFGLTLSTFVLSQTPLPAHGVPTPGQATIACVPDVRAPGDCTRAAPPSDPFGLGVVDIQIRYHGDSSGRPRAVSTRLTVLARDRRGRRVASLHILGGTGTPGGAGGVRLEVFVRGSSAIAHVDDAGRVIVDEISGTRFLDVISWLSDSIPDTRMKESCSWYGEECWCQCETSWLGDHAVCFGLKMLAVANGWDADSGWWYQQRGRKCGKR